jgi:hypothetical protein
MPPSCYFLQNLDKSMALLILPMSVGQHKTHIWAGKRLKLYETKLCIYNIIFVSIINLNKFLKMVKKSTRHL